MCCVYAVLRGHFGSPSALVLVPRRDRCNATTCTRFCQTGSLFTRVSATRWLARAVRLARARLAAEALGALSVAPAISRWTKESANAAALLGCGTVLTLVFALALVFVYRKVRQHDRVQGSHALLLTMASVAQMVALVQLLGMTSHLSVVWVDPIRSVLKAMIILTFDLHHHVEY